MTTRNTRLTWGRFAAVMAVGAAPTLLAVAAMPLYGWVTGREPSAVPSVRAACNVTPGIFLLIAAGGLVRAFLAKDASRRDAAWATAAAGASAFAVFVVLLFLFANYWMWVLCTGDR
jgi:hypothetical protein